MTKISLAHSDQQALREFVEYLEETKRDQIEHIALFGSKARGDSQRESDLDILVILSEEDRELRREISRQAARISLKYDVLLSPRVIGMERWEQMRGFSIYRNVQREAAVLAVENGNLEIEPA